MGFLDKKAAGSSSVAALNHGVTIITAGCHFNGKLYCRGVSRIGGSIDGEIIAEGLLIIEEDAVIKADIKAVEVVIQGKVEGRLEAENRVELINTGHFTGDLVAPSLHVEDGAILNGTMKMVSKKAPVEKIDDHKKKREQEAKNAKAQQAKNNNAHQVEPSVDISDSEQVAKTPEVGIK